jgi:prepilin-type processing-associated H-X9-DG protein
MTLVELLVVMGIAMVLLGVLAPALGGARRLARCTVCQSHQREIAGTLTLYEVQQRRLPPAFAATPQAMGPCAGDPDYDPPGRWWFEAAQVSEAARWCPDRKVAAPGNVLWGNFGVNEHVLGVVGHSDWRSAIGQAGRAKVEQPCETLLLLDCGYAKMGWYHAVAPPPWRLLPLPEQTAYVPGLELNADKPLLAVQVEDATLGRHPERTVNVVLADGHAERTSANALETVSPARTRGGYFWAGE